jgi:hypothetical protein
VNGAGTLADPERLVAAWEAAAAVPGIARAAVLLHAAGAVESLDEALDLPLGDAAARSAELYAAAFDEVLAGLVNCDGCGELLEVQVPLAALGAPVERATARVEHAGATLEVRAPTTRDLLAAAGDPDPAAVLLARCVSDPAGAAIDPAGLAPSMRERVDAAAEELAGAATVTVQAACPACGAGVRAAADVADLLWEQVGAAAPSVLGEVAELAAAFGWSETEGLTLSPARRRSYLDLVRGGPGEAP